MALSEPIAINRSRSRKAIDQVVQGGRERLASGRYVIIFPEGTRMPSGRPGRFKLGGARLAHTARCPILPVAHNAGRFWARRSYTKEPGTIQVVIGPPIETINRDPAQLNALNEDWITKTVAALDAETRGCS
jgi:1-acyl-sn-glycerol-3-phosphate acyltransferase